MSRKRRSVTHNTHNNVVELTQALYLNGKAVQEGPRRKHWSRHDLKHIRPLTPTQEEMFQDFFNGNNIVAHGSAGTGKSYIALFLALNEYLKVDSTIERIIIVRSAVPTREIGFLPGTLTEKVALYELPYKDIFADLMGRYSTYEDMKEAGIVQFCTTSFIRGLTWDNTIVVVDEAQNMTWGEFDSIITRLGENSRFIICGDHSHQCDLKKGEREMSCFGNLLKLAGKLPNVSALLFTPNDIVRSTFVKQWIVEREAMGM
jgi:phosphate starvation-inducible protein PhoH